MKYSTTASQEKTFEEKANGVLKSIITDGMSDYNKVKTIHDYICDKVTYDYAHMNDDSYSLCHTAYAALVNGTSVCDRVPEKRKTVELVKVMRFSNQLLLSVHSLLFVIKTVTFLPNIPK